MIKILWILCVLAVAAAAHADCISKLGFDYCAPGTSIKLTVTPQVGSKFIKWVGDECNGSKNPVCSFPMPSHDVYMEAWFEGGWVNPVKRMIYVKKQTTVM